MEALSALLQKPYSQDNWLNIIESTFTNVSIIPPVDIPFNEDLNDKIESFRQFGTVTLADGNRLPLIELKVTERIRLRQNRVQLRQLIARLIDQNTAHGVLAVFDTGEDHYRFSFTAKESAINEEGEFVESETDKKRYTYVLGRNEQTRTAAEQFAFLKQKGDSVTIKDVVAAFNVEPLTKEFFDRYKKYYEDFVQFITGKRFEKVNGKWKEVKKGEPSPFHLQVFNSDDKNARNYIKLLLGRLVFIKFLQKKSWMGVPPDEAEWKNGDPKFIYNLYNNFKNKDNFHSNALLPLFDHLNAHSSSDLFTLTKTKIPALNGGLFERQYENLEVLVFPAELFEGFLEFLEQYNFTIDESDPDDAEVGIDPEMLGHIFENLLEDNKDKGAFYTPKPIVKYMCQESIIEYLYTYFEKNNLLGNEQANTQLKQNIERFIKKHEGSAINDHEKTIAKALKEVKVCDPAIGSGAFPMGILLEIFGAVNLLYDNFTDSTSEVWNLEKWEPARIKEHIIQNSIYGVDIEKGAVDIARLRFWLSLIIDEEVPRYLPNLDYKIVVGNSLLPKFNGKIIEIDWSPRQSLQGRAAELHKQVQQHLAEVVKAQKNYFNANNEQKTTIKEQIRTAKLQLIKSQTLFNKERFILSNQITEDDSRLNAREKKENQAKKEQLAQFDETVTYIETLIADNTISFSHFDWKLDFPEILNPNLNNRPGFDIVIGNPPYGLLNKKQNKHTSIIVTEIELEMFKDGLEYGAFNYKMINVFQLFIIKSLNILDENGVFCEIYPLSFTGDQSFYKLRKHILENKRLTKIEAFPERDNPKKRVFESVKMSVLIALIKNSKSTSSFNLRINNDKFINTKIEPTTFSKEEIYSIDKKYFTIPLLPEKEKAIITKVYQFRNVISNVAKCNTGEVDISIDNEYITDNCNDKYLIKGAAIDKFIIKNEMSQGEIQFIHNSFLEKLAEERKIHYSSQRIVMQGITGINERTRLKMAIAPPFTFCANSVNYISIEKKETNIYALLGVLNSKLLNFVFKKFSTNSNVNGYEIDNLPLPKFTKIVQEKIGSIVLQLLSESDYNNREVLINSLELFICKLYGLEFEDLKFIELSFNPSLDEYISIVIPEENNQNLNLSLFTEGTLFHNIN